jgi:hypothetical protein
LSKAGGKVFQRIACFNFPHADVASRLVYIIAS